MFFTVNTELLSKLGSQLGLVENVRYCEKRPGSNLELCTLINMNDSLNVFVFQKELMFIEKNRRDRAAVLIQKHFKGRK